MTNSVPRTSAIALGVAAFVSLSTLSAARADSSAEPAPTPSAPVTAQPRRQRSRRRLRLANQPRPLGGPRPGRPAPRSLSIPAHGTGTTRATTPSEIGRAHV